MPFSLPSFIAPPLVQPTALVSLTLAPYGIKAMANKSNTEFNCPWLARPRKSQIPIRKQVTKNHRQKPGHKRAPNRPKTSRNAHRNTHIRAPTITLATGFVSQRVNGTSRKLSVEPIPDP
jgi:hypothetical protein